MIKLSKITAASLFALTFLFGIINLFLFYDNRNDIIFFKYLNKFFLLLLLSGIFFSIHLKNKNGKKIKLDNLMNNPILTLLIMIFGIIIFSLFILGLIKFGFGDKEVLYWQISTFVLSFSAFILFIDNHMKLLKKSEII